MSKRQSTPVTVRTPFENLKFLIILNKALGLVSCKLTNGRFKQSSVWSRCYCTAWIFLHCTYTGIYFYRKSILLSEEQANLNLLLSVLRYTTYFVSLLPYHYVIISRSRDFVKFSDKLETYDDKATALGHQRGDNHMFLWLYFLYTLCTTTTKTYYAFELFDIGKGGTKIVEKVCMYIIPNIVGCYCVFITCIYLDVIRQRFRHLNEVIVPQVAQLPVTGSRGEITVYDVRYLHGVLLDSAKLINSLYGFGTLYVFTSTLLEFVSVIYLSLENNADGENVLLTTMDLLFQVIYLFSMYHFTTFETNRVEERVARYGVPFQNVRCRVDKIEIMLYFYHSRFMFTAAQFFILDLTLLLSISTTVMTFITIIL